MFEFNSEGDFEVSVFVDDVLFVGGENEYLLISEDLEIDFEFNFDIVANLLVFDVKSESPGINVVDPVIFFISLQEFVLKFKSDSVSIDGGGEFNVDFVNSDFDVMGNGKFVLFNHGGEVEIEFGNSNFNVVSDFNLVGIDGGLVFEGEFPDGVINLEVPLDNDAIEVSS